MRPGLIPEGPVEHIAIRMNAVPVVDGHAMFGMPMARAVMAGLRLGVFERLAGAPASAADVARDLGTSPDGTVLLLESLVALGHLQRRREAYSLPEATRKWLDPKSETYIGTHIENCFDYWAWWDRLEDVVRTGRGIEIHEFSPTDPHWRRYIRGQFELARLSAPDVAKAMRLPARPTSLLDVAGGHGWFSAELCRRHRTLRATVLDLPGSVAVGREILAEQGMSERVTHVEGDMMDADLGGPHDGALVFNIAHHLSPEQNVALLRRIHEALVPGGTVAMLDLWLPEQDRRPDVAALLGLFFYLTSGAATYTEHDARSWLAEAGFEQTRRVTIRRLPGQALFEARKPG